MQFTDRRAVTRWIIIATSFLIVVLILWNTYSFFQIFKEEERVKMNQWALAQKKMAAADLDADIELPFEIIQNAHIPIMVTQQGKIVNHINIDPSIEKDSLQMRAL